jgi:hypothetical protein
MAPQPAIQGRDRAFTWLSGLPGDTWAEEDLTKMLASPLQLTTQKRLLAL